MSFMDKLFRWKKKPFGGKPAHPDSGRDQSGKDKSGGSEVRGSGRYAHILIRPHTSERAASAQTINQYVFEVAPFATKPEVALAVRDLYGVKPIAVNIINMRGKYTRFGRVSGTTRAWKKAIVKLPEGKTIDVYKK